MAKQLAREPDEAALYESDFYTWCMREARLLREGRLAELDLPNLAEEIASLGNEQEHALGSSLRILLVHLLKWRYQAKRRTRSWAGTIVRERGNYDDRLLKNPGLKSIQGELLARAYRRARREAAAETGLPLAALPESCPFTLAQVLDDDFWPEPADPAP
jgi:Domain of unknown function DUF29